jgi:Na+/H+-dicarboxylate symporter
MLNTKDSLYETYFDIRLNMEIYKTFGFALTPFLVLFVVGLMYFEISKTQEIVLNNLQNSHLIILFVLIAFCILFMGIALEWWVKYFYGKYAKEIKKVLEELKEQ